MKISQRPSLRSLGAALLAVAFMVWPAAFVIAKRKPLSWGEAALWIAVTFVLVFVEDRWLLAALKRWVWNQHVRLTLHVGPDHVFSRPFIIEKGAKFEAADGVVYESIEDASIEIGASRTEIVVRRISS